MGRQVLLLGNPKLRMISGTVSDFGTREFSSDLRDLKEALETFRAKNGFGRGIAAVQIGIEKRMIALNLGRGTFVIVNPRILEKSGKTFTMWDDCMSFPDLLVRVSRHESIVVEYQDERGGRALWQDPGRAESELLQHEIDHLDGTLALDRAIEKTDIVYRREFENNREYYEKMADYVIAPTIGS